MKKWIILILMMAAPVWAQTPSETFAEAQSAYDAGQMTEAIALYSTLIADGFDNAELLYNLGNAHFKIGQIPEAVENYRRAQYRSPRDPDIRANLQFALGAAKAVPPEPAGFEYLSRQLTPNIWTLVMAGSYGALILLLMLVLFIRPAKRLLLQLTPIPLVLAAVAGLSIRQWALLKQEPEMVVIRSEATALYGPIEGSTAHYNVPAGAIVRQRDIDAKGWMKIEYDGKTGWLKSDYLRRI